MADGAWEEERARQDRRDEKSWYEYRQLVLAELNRLNNGIAGLGTRIDANYQTTNGELAKMVASFNAELSKIKVDVAMLQVKSGLWGALAGGVITISAILLKLLVK